MLLKALSQYADRIEMPPRLYAETSVRYIIELDAAGRPYSPRPVDTADPSSARTRRGQRYLMPEVVRSSGIKPLLLADTGTYVLGVAREGDKPDRVRAYHAAFKALLARCAEVTGSPDVEAVLAFLDSDPLSKLQLPDDFDPGAKMTFRVAGRFPTDNAGVQRFWATEYDPALRGAPTMQCLVCGERKPVLERLPGKIKGIRTGQTSGTALIGMNAAAFESYGLGASLNAPTCMDCAERFTKAANQLLRGDETHYHLAGAELIFWTRDPAATFNLMTYIREPTPAEVKDLVRQVYSARGLPLVDETRFYAASLTGSGGRAVVRDWIDTTVRQVKSHLAEWFARQRIVQQWGDEPAPLGVYALAAATVRDPARELAPTTARALLRSAVAGTPLPPGILYQAVRRNRAEQRITRPRAALIKLALLARCFDHEEDFMVQLEPDHPNVAYHCGRLLAVLEQVQRLAVPSAKATIVDRFFGTASSAPAAVYGRLLRGAQPHLAKLERDRRGAYIALQRRLEEILGHVGGFPKTLTLEDQALFSLGYYHQRAHDRAKAREAAERRAAGDEAPEAELSEYAEAAHEDSG
jgi:CRISPR-associated protein Csd1